MCSQISFKMNETAVSSGSVKVQFCNSTFVKAGNPSIGQLPPSNNMMWLEFSVGSTFQEARLYGSGMTVTLQL